MNLEKLLEAKMRDKIRALGGWAVKFWPVSLAGFPDRMVLMPKARIYFVELKSESKTPTPIQKIMHTKLRRLGFDVFVIDSAELLIEFLNKVQHDQNV